jgi:class 3 adenylate cyclase
MRTIEEWRDNIRHAIGRSELLEAYDLAERALAEYPDDPHLRWAAVLVLARSGATRQARDRYNRFKMNEVTNGDHAFLTDLASLDARIAKDEALQENGHRRKTMLQRAADLYEAIFRRSGDYYPGVNAASLALLCGDPSRAESLAREVLKVCGDQTPTSREEYYVRASQAEAHLVLGEVEAARTALRAAANSSDRDFSAVATTRRQLRRVCEARRIKTEVLDTLLNPAVIHYAGHLIGARFPQSRESDVAGQIEAALKNHNVGFGYGSLASGADILFAEALVDRGAELNITLPFELEEFKRVSVAPAGEQWLVRFDTCLKQAKRITFATTDQYLRDNTLFAYASRIAMGLARLRARFLDATPLQLVVWDGAPDRVSHANYGTGLDAATWRKFGLSGEIISPVAQISDNSSKGTARRHRRRVSRKPARREIRAMLFGDIKWFSHLTEAQIPVFTRTVLGRFARVIDRHRRKILNRNTWGDGLKILIADIETAARCAIELQEEMKSFDPVRHGLPDYLALRLGGHIGPIYRLRDPVVKKMSFTGAHVTRAARIEPVTPEGAVYVTEAFAAELTMLPKSDFTCEYVGQIVAPKDYGTMPLYSLRRWRGTD